MRILLINAHPDASRPHFGHALLAAYAEGANTSGHELRRLDLATLDFPLLRSQEEWEHAPCPPGLAGAQQDILWAQHLVFVYPLWLGDMPALLKGFLEQVARPGFAFGKGAIGSSRELPLKGKTARIVVTMGMPGLLYRFFFIAHSLRSFKRNILGFVGIRTTGSEVIGMVEGMKDAQRQRWLDRMRKLGQQGQ